MAGWANKTNICDDGEPSFRLKVLECKGAKVKATIETQQFDKSGFLKLSGIWRNKTEKEIGVYREIMKERGL